jgi:hypothetical protein
MYSDLNNLEQWHRTTLRKARNVSFWSLVNILEQLRLIVSHIPQVFLLRRCKTGKLGTAAITAPCGSAASVLPLEFGGRYIINERRESLAGVVKLLPCRIAPEAFYDDLAHCIEVRVLRIKGDFAVGHCFSCPRAGQ